VRRLHPPPFDDHVDVASAYLDVSRPRPADRPWVTILMIESVDGGTMIDGRSGALGGAGDKAVYAVVRSLGDAVLVGAATVRAEVYRPLPPPRRLFVVSGSGEVPAELAAAVTTVLVQPAAGQKHVDLGAAVRSWHDVAHVVCEGGPTLNGQLLAQGLVDEVCVTVAPRFVAGESARLAHTTAGAEPSAWTLAHVLADDDGFLFLRYTR
jgi:riboflavin biosynthesis pyrimidine reductase